MPIARPGGHLVRQRRIFDSSQAWRRVRYAELRANREKYGRLTCEVCGTTEGPWHVDHVIPISIDWSRRLDPTNVQVACEPCNLGKSNTNSIDWRDPTEATASSE